RRIAATTRPIRRARPDICPRGVGLWRIGTVPGRLADPAYRKPNDTGLVHDRRRHRRAGGDVRAPRNRPCQARPHRFARRDARMKLSITTLILAALVVASLWFITRWWRVERRRTTAAGKRKPGSIELLI